MNHTPLVGYDKYLHAVAGFMLAAVGYVIGALAWGQGLGLTLAAALCVLGAVGREAYNLANGERFDWADVAWTLAGGFPVALSAYMVLLWPT